MISLTKKLLVSSALIASSFSPMAAGMEELSESFKSEAKSAQLSNRRSKRAIGDPIGDEFGINQVNFGRSAYRSSVASLANENVFVAWYGNQAGSDDIYGKVFSPQGVATGSEFRINQNTTGSQFNPSVTGLSDGNVFVAWEGFQTGPSNIYGIALSPQGTAIGNEFIINQVTTGGQLSPSVTALTNGNMFVVWRGDQTGNQDLYGRVISPQGVAIGSEFGINQVTTGDQYGSSVASLTDGNVFVAWHGDQAGNGNFNIYGRVFSPQGVAIGSEFLINQVTTLYQNTPSVASLTDGNVFVAWAGTQFTSPSAYIRGRLFYSNGTSIGNEFTISQNTRLLQQVPSAKRLTGGNVFVAWYEVDQTGLSYDIYGRGFSPQGTSISNEFVINQNTTGNQLDPSVTGLSDGNVFVAWTGDQIGYNEIYGRIISGQLTPSPTAAPNSNPTAAPTSSANRLIPSWVIPVKVVIGGFKDLWNIATNKNENWKNRGVNLDEIEDASWRKSSVLKENGEKSLILETSRSTQTIQMVGNYIKSWFSSESWSGYFNSMEKSILDYSQSVVKETPSYHSFYLGNQTFNGNDFFVSNISCNPTIGAGFLPHSVVSGAIGQ